MLNKDKLKAIKIIDTAYRRGEKISRELVCEKSGIPSGSFRKRIGCSFKVLTREFNIRIDGNLKLIRCDDRELRVDNILSVGKKMLRENQKITRKSLAEKAEISPALISYQFGSMTNLRKILGIYK